MTSLHLISPYNIIPESHIKVMRIKEMITNKEALRALNHFTNTVHFIVTCLVTKPLNRSEAKGDLVAIQTSLLFKYKLL